jgi:hypothetical protein
LRVHRLARRARQLRGLFRQRAHEFGALLGDQLDGVGGQQLIIADRGGNGARAAMLDTRLHIVIAGAAGLERIDPHRLLAGETGRRGDAGIGALELDFAGRPLRRELEMLQGGLHQIGDDRNGLVQARRMLGFGLRRRVDRPLRPAIDRRLGQDIIIERDG